MVFSFSGYCLAYLAAGFNGQTYVYYNAAEKEKVPMEKLNILMIKAPMNGKIRF